MSAHAWYGIWPPSCADECLFHVARGQSITTAPCIALRELPRLKQYCTSMVRPKACALHPLTVTETCTPTEPQMLSEYSRQYKKALTYVHIQPQMLPAHVCHARARAANVPPSGSPRCSASCQQCCCAHAWAGLRIAAVSAPSTCYGLCSGLTSKSR